jgi:xanthine dehydrogenase accessory factor
MNGTWIDAVVRAVAVAPVVRAVVIDAKGSTPREIGAWMLISRVQCEGTIGGGALEYACVKRARAMLAEERSSLWQRAVESFHLGPELNQCCGGAVTILLEMFGADELVALHAHANRIGDWSTMHPLVTGEPITWVAAGEARFAALGVANAFVEALWPARTPLLLYGAGHVGRALMRALDGLPFVVTWCDSVRAREFADERIVEGDLPELAGQALGGAYHVVMTHSHSLDEEIVAAVLEAGTFGYVGLIGSATKEARFRQRLLKAGIDKATVAQMHCPIGLSGLVGKVPAVIAASIAADLLLRRQKQIDPGAAVQ